MGHVSGQRLEVIEYLISRNVFQSLVDEHGTLLLPHGITAPRRAVYVGCPDCDEMKDLMVYHGCTLKQKLHKFGEIHGGTAGFNPDSPVNDGAPVKFPVEWYLWGISEGMRIKETDEVANYSHFQCVGTGELTVAQVLELHFYNVRYMKQGLLEHHGVIARTFSYGHVDYGLKRKKTYGLNRRNWMTVRGEFTGEIKQLPYQLEMQVAA